MIETYGLWVVFVCVLLDQGGLPFPAYPAMIVTAGLATDAGGSLAPILVVATLATLLADLAWFAGGRRFGATLLKTLCKLSLSADSCVGMTRRIYGRWGAPSLVVSKYVPGFAAVATTLAGETGTHIGAFLLYDGIGAMFWAGGAIALGAIFHEAVEVLLAELSELGRDAIGVLVGVLALFVAFKWWQRRRFLMQIRMARVTPEELTALLGSDEPVTVLDVRSPERRRTGWIPGSIHVVDVEALELPEQGEIVAYCDCPNDATAAVAVAKLKKRGIVRARPLAGGIDAWRAQGLPIETASSERASAA